MSGSNSASLLHRSPAGGKHKMPNPHKVSSSTGMLLKLNHPDQTTGKRQPLFDAHLHYLDYFQRTDGMESFSDAMEAAGVTHAMICGCALKKVWSEYEDHPPDNAISDTDQLAYFSLTDGARALTREPSAFARAHARSPVPAV